MSGPSRSRGDRVQASRVQASRDQTGRVQAGRVQAGRDQTGRVQTSRETSREDHPRRDDRRPLGAAGEQVAAEHLTAGGMEVLERNWRCPVGEIDLVLRDGSTLVVCEVKTRRTRTFGDPVEAITRAKLARLRRLTAAWLAAHPDHRWSSVRIDIVGVLAHPDGSMGISHLRAVG